MKQYIFKIEHPGEPAAGIASFSNKVDIVVEYDPGGDPGEFETFMAKSLADWFDVSKIKVVQGIPDFMSQALNEGDGVYRP